MLRVSGDLRQQVVRLNNPKRGVARKSHVDTAAHCSCNSGRVGINSGCTRSQLGSAHQSVDKYVASLGT